MKRKTNRLLEISIILNVIFLMIILSIIYIVRLYQKKALEQYTYIFSELDKILSTTSIVDVKFILVRIDDLIMKRYSPNKDTKKILSLIKNNVLNYLFQHNEHKMKIQESAKKITKIIHYIITNVITTLQNSDGDGSLQSTLNLLVSIHSDYFIYMKLFGRPSTDNGFDQRKIQNIRYIYDQYIQEVDITPETHIIDIPRFKMLYEKEYGNI